MYIDRYIDRYRNIDIDRYRYVDIDIDICVCVRIYIYIHIYIYVCVCISLRLTCSFYPVLPRLRTGCHRGCGRVAARAEVTAAAYICAYGIPIFKYTCMYVYR